MIVLMRILSTRRGLLAMPPVAVEFPSVKPTASPPTVQNAQTKLTLPPWCATQRPVNLSLGQQAHGPPAQRHAVAVQKHDQ